MTLAQDFEDFVKLLNKHQVDYMVVGGYALAFHGKLIFNNYILGIIYMISQMSK
jgi:hypothetical protein